MFQRRNGLFGTFLIFLPWTLAGALAAQPMAPLSGPDVDERIFARLLDQETVRVLVILKTPEVAEDSGSEVYRHRIGQMQDRLLAALGDRELTVTHRLASRPILAGEITGAGLTALRSRPEVLSIGLDEVVEGHLLESVPLVGADAVQGLGFTGAGVTVAVLDSGIDTDHPDLQDDVVGQQCFCTADGANLDGPPCCPNGAAQQSGAGAAEDDQGHGTWVSGMITSAGASARVGVAPDAAIVAVKVLNSANRGFCSDIVAGLDWVLMNRPDVDVVNMSLGLGSLQNGECDNAGSACIQALEPVLDDLRNSNGALPFASSGNDGSSTGMRAPACLSTVVSVGAVYDDDVGSNSFNSLPCNDPTTAADQITCYSNGNAETDLLAPGTCVASSNLGGGVTGCGQGTSASSPLAAACAALALDAFPGLAPDQVEALLTSTGVPVFDARNSETVPRIDCLAALCAECGDPMVDVTVPDPITPDCTVPGGIPGNDPLIEDWLDLASASSACGVPALTHDAPGFFPSCMPGDPEVVSTTEVTFEATHACGFSAQETSRVDLTHISVPDIFAPPDLFLECSTPGGVPKNDPAILAWLGLVDGTDSCDDVNTFTNSLGGAADPLPAGCGLGAETPVIFTGIDECGNSHFAVSSIFVTDTGSPEVTCQVATSTLWPVNKKLVDVGLSFQVTDTCDGAPDVTLDVTSDEPPSTPKAFCPDVVIGDDLSVRLRAERLGTGDGRVYAIRVTATDSCGNQGSCVVEVAAPKNQNGAPAVDSEQAFEAADCG